MSLFSCLKGEPSSASASTSRLKDVTGKIDLSLMIFTDTPFVSMEEAFLHLIEVQDYILDTKPVKEMLMGLMAASILFSLPEKKGSGVIYTFSLRDLVSLIAPEEVFSASSFRKYSYERNHELKGRRSLLRFNVAFEPSGLYGEPLLTVLLSGCKQKDIMSKAPAYLKLWRLQVKDHTRGTQFSLN